MGRGFSNESKFVMIGHLEPEIWVDKEIASKWKIYISKLKPVKDIERLIIIIIKTKQRHGRSYGQIFMPSSVDYSGRVRIQKLTQYKEK
jgi:hypothetical protein